MIKKHLLKKFVLSLVLILLTNSAYGATEFVCAINKSGEDYNTLTLWEAAMDDAGDITAADCKVFSHSGITGTINDLDSVTGKTSGATGTVIHASSTQILIDAISGTFSDGEQVYETVDTNYVVISDAGDSAIIVAECYNDDGDLDDQFTISGFTTSSSNYVKITSPAAERHDGTNSSGFTIAKTWAAAEDSQRIVYIGSQYTIVEWIIVEMGALGGNYEYNSGIYEAGRYSKVRNNIVVCTGIGIGSSRSWTGIYVNGASRAGSAIQWYCYDNIVYSFNEAETDWVGIRANHWGQYSNDFNDLYIYNNTTYDNNQNIKCESGTGGVGNFWINNNLAVDASSADFTFDADGSYQSNDYNASSDATATGANSLNTASASDFVSTTAGSEDLHLASGAVEIDEGTDLGVSPSGVEIDIDGRDRDSEGDVWDIGADEYVATTTSFTPKLIFY